MMVLYVFLILAVFLGIPVLIMAYTSGLFDSASKDTDELNAQYGYGTRQALHTQFSALGYYKDLSDQGKRKFIDKVLLHHSRLKFTGMEGFVPARELEMMLCGTAAQLTLHLDDEWLASFSEVELHPTVFRMNEHGPLMSGATTANGIIRISVKDYLDGYRISNDRKNVGLHEFSHALLIEFKDSANNYDDMNDLVMPYEQIAHHEMNAGYDSAHVLRKYAFTNYQEFFAVSIEAFYETPQDLKSTHPDLYRIITRLLRQDPMNVQQDYRLIPAY